MSNPLGSLIARGEGGYNDYNRGTYTKPNGKQGILPANQEIDFSQMTIAELQRRQHLPKSDPDFVFAVGKYQIIPGTMSEVVARMRLDPNERYTPQLQERIFAEDLLHRKRPDIYTYITDQPGATLQKAQIAVAMEWASVDDPRTPGVPYGDYAKRGNRSSIRAPEVADALNEMRTSYLELRSQGKSEADAWRTVTGQSGPVAAVTPMQQRAHTQTGREPSVDPLADGKLQLGERGDAVRGLQRSLNDLHITDERGQPLETKSGVYGAHTEAAVRKFQQAIGLAPTGTADKATLEAIGKQLSPGSVTAEAEVTGPVQEHRPALLKQGAHGPEVWGLQTTLKGLGYPGADGKPLAVDSDFGCHTDHAVRAFQKAHDLEVDGKVGKDTHAALVQAAKHPLVSEATHPNHNLYQALVRQLPAGTDPKAIANVTLQALENGIKGPDQFKKVWPMGGSDIAVEGVTPGYGFRVDLGAPTADLQAMSDHMRQQAEQRTQEQQQRRQQPEQPQTISI